MAPSVGEILQIVETLAHGLTETIDDDMRAGGWRDESVLRMSGTLEELATEIRLVDDLPPKSERPWDMIRGLDSLGIHGGGPL